jgi:hypothetical protein
VGAGLGISAPIAVRVLLRLGITRSASTISRPGIEGSSNGDLSSRAIFRISRFWRTVLRSIGRSRYYISLRPVSLVNPSATRKSTIAIMSKERCRCCARCARQPAKRYFNASGADPAGEIDEDHDPETHLIPRALMAIQGRSNDFAIYGDDYDTPDGTPIRDYIHVTDLAHAHVLALNCLLSGGEGGCFNLGTGQGYSVKQILGQILAETGNSTPYTIRNRRPGDPPVLVADPTQAKTVLGFQPRYSDLPSIVRTAWKWHQKCHRHAGSGARQVAATPNQEHLP